MSDEEFKMKVVSFMGRIEEHLSNQKENCAGHTIIMNSIADRTTVLEEFKDNAIGVWKAVAIGVPTLGSVAYAAFELWRYTHQ